MNTLYWFGVLGGFATTFCAQAIILGVIFIIAFVAFIVLYVDEGKDDESTLPIKRMLWKIFIPLCITIMAGIFIPSKEDMYMIYGVGGTLDYLKENPEAGKLPDKTIEFLNVAMDEYIKDHKDEETEE